MTATRSPTRHLRLSTSTTMAARSRFRRRVRPAGDTMASHAHDTIPAWTWALPAAASVLLALKYVALVPADHGFVLALAGLLLGGSVFAAVHHAEVLALKLGEPFGSILLAIAVTVIEVALIASIMLSGSAGSDAVARD